MSVPIAILYHADCLDGFGAAYAAWTHFGNTARYIPCHHGMHLEPSAYAGHRLYLLDYALPPEMLTTLAQHAASVTVIDHHLSAWQAWASHFGEQAPVDYQHPHAPLRLIFDLEQAGCALSWQHFQPGQPMPLALQHIAANDLWQHTDPDTRPFCRALRLLDFDFATWQPLMTVSMSADDFAYRQQVDRGQTVERFLILEVARMSGGRLPGPARLRGEPADALQALRHGQDIVTDGLSHWHALPGLAANAPPLFASDLGHRLAQLSGTWGMTWHLDGNGQIKASLRSEGAVDVAAIAQRYGGGGHRKAAGFQMAALPFFREVLGL